MQAYSDKKRANDPHALPDIEVFYVRAREFESEEYSGGFFPRGWYWQSCFPGCLPDGEPIGPFKTEAEALADAQSDVD